MQILPHKLLTYFGCIILLSAVPSFLNAQEIQITYSSGGEFSVSTGGYRVFYQGGSPDIGALVLKKDDVIQTGAESFVELRVEPSGTRIKIAENTSLACNGNGAETLSVSFSLLYGRMRIATESIWPHGEGNAVYINAGQVETIIRHGDVGIDFIVDTNLAQLTRGEPILSVYNFYGNSEIMPVSWRSSANQGHESGFKVFEYEALSVEVANSMSYIMRTQLDDGIINYWNTNNFSDNPLFIKLRSAAYPSNNDQAPVIERIEYVNADYQPIIIEQIFPDNPFHKKLFRIKNFLISSGMIFTTGGIGMQIAGSHGIPNLDRKANKMIFNFGYVPLVIGLIFSGAALVINPQNMEKNAAD